MTKDFFVQKRRTAVLSYALGLVLTATLTGCSPTSEVAKTPLPSATVGAPTEDSSPASLSDSESDDGNSQGSKAPKEGVVIAEAPAVDVRVGQELKLSWRLRDNPDLVSVAFEKEFSLEAGADELGLINGSRVYKALEDEGVDVSKGVRVLVVAKGGSPETTYATVDIGKEETEFLDVFLRRDEDGDVWIFVETGELSK